MNEKTFRPWPDSLSVIITIGYVVLFFGCILWAFRGESWSFWIPFIAGITAPVIGCIFAPDGMKKEGRNLIVHKAVFSDRVINLNEYDMEYHYDDFDMSGYVRTFGSFGYYGWWGRWRRQSDQRRVDSYLMNRKYNVAVLTPKEGDGAIILVNIPREWAEE